MIYINFRNWHCSNFCCLILLGILYHVNALLFQLLKYKQNQMAKVFRYTNQSSSDIISAQPTIHCFKETLYSMFLKKPSLIIYIATYKRYKLYKFSCRKAQWPMEWSGAVAHLWLPIEFRKNNIAHLPNFRIYYFRIRILILKLFWI